MKRYKAVKRGFDNVKIREVGEEFEFNGMPSDWMVEIDDEGQVIGDDKSDKKKPGRPPKVPQE